MSKNRQNRRIASIVEPAYEITHRSSKCYYCGDQAQCYDHSPPLNATYRIGTDEMIARGYTLEKVACCNECNVLLGARIIMRLSERVLFLYSALQKRYKKELALPYWSEDELKELDISILSTIENTLLVKNWVNRRLEFMEDIHRV